jgi:prepilin-type N-terminal cleavage/methylation domain-containing protein
MLASLQRQGDDTSAHGHPWAKGRRAFTLLELIVVMALIGTLMALAAPTMRGFLASRQTADGALSMLALTQWCRSEAISQGRRTRLNLDSEGRTAFVTVDKAGNFVAPEAEAGRQVPLPDGAHAAIRVGPSGGAPSTFVQFYPNGRSDATTIEITGKQGDLYLLTSAAPTEAYHVVTPAEGAK